MRSCKSPSKVPVSLQHLMYNNLQPQLDIELVCVLDIVTTNSPSLISSLPDVESVVAWACYELVTYLPVCGFVSKESCCHPLLYIAERWQQRPSHLQESVWKTTSWLDRCWWGHWPSSGHLSSSPRHHLDYEWSVIWSNFGFNSNLVSHQYLRAN